MPKYYAQTALIIESIAFERGDVVGTGNIGDGSFEPSNKKHVGIVEPGHIAARLNTGKIKTTAPPPLARGSEGGGTEERQRRQEALDRTNAGEGAALDAAQARIRELEAQATELAQRADENEKKAEALNGEVETLRQQLDEAQQARVKADGGKTAGSKGKGK